jgi:hypothetical protein
MAARTEAHLMALPQPPIRRPRQPQPSRRPLLAVGLLGLAAGAGAIWLAGRSRDAKADREQTAAKGLAAGAAVLALSVAIDSGIEHYRGGFSNRAMFAAPTVAAATLIAALAPARSGGLARRAVFATALATGAAGAGFHVYDVGKREGGFDLLNLFYAAPLGAPAALGLAGLYGLLGERFAMGETRLLGASAPRVVAPLIAFSLAGTAAEAGFLHFRGAFQNPLMYAPVTIPPLAAAAMIAAAVTPAAVPACRTLLRATAVLGLAGPLFHAYGIHRNMGGWHNWRQMILQGPPLPAPPAFTGIAAAGLALLPLLAGEQ